MNTTASSDLQKLVAGERGAVAFCAGSLTHDANHCLNGLRTTKHDHQPDTTAPRRPPGLRYASHTAILEGTMSDDQPNATDPTHPPLDAVESAASVSDAAGGLAEAPTAPMPTVSETTVPDTTVPESTVPETTLPETTVPETTVTEALQDAPANADGTDGADHSSPAEVETAAAAADAVAEEGSLTESERAAEHAGLRYQVGDIVPGVVTEVREDGVDVDLGGGALAVIPKSERVGELPAAGASVEGKVIRRQGGNGRLVLSPRRAVADRAWTSVQAAFEAGSTLTGTIKEHVKGGYIVDLGLRAFLPESLVDVRRGARLASGEQVEVAVIECEKPAGRPERVVVDRRQVRERNAASDRDAIVAQLQVGMRRTGRITAVTNFGAFVDLGGAEGLIHVSQLAHRQVADPREVVQVGQEVDVEIIDIRRERGKIALSRKSALPDPFTAFQSSHGIGDLVFGTVTSLAPFGAFVAIDGADVEGLVHISELSRYRVETADEVVSVGEGIWVKILGVDPGKRRLSLSLRRALED
jgi:small subunit ribosomal protein S1